jgi:hypothetical protein
LILYFVLFALFAFRLSFLSRLFVATPPRWILRRQICLSTVSTGPRISRDRSLLLKPMFIVSLLLALITDPEVGAATIDDVTFLTRIEAYEAIVNTVLVTQEGKRLPIDKGTRVNVAGFTETEALVVSRTDRPNGFIRKSDLTPAQRSNALEAPHIKEETLR